MAAAPRTCRASDAELIDEFIDALWLADGLSKNTLESYRSDLALFSDWLAGRHATIVGADETAINGYLAFLHARPGGIRSASQRRLMASLRRCYRWLLDQGRLQRDPLLNIDKPVTTQRFPKTLSEKQVEDLLGAPDVATPLGLRDRAILETLYSTGLRRAEIGALRVDELDPDNGTVFVREGLGVLARRR